MRNCNALSISLLRADSSKKGDEAAQLKQAAESATAELRQSLQRKHDRAEALVTELRQARRTMGQKPAVVEEKPAAKQSEGVAAENSKPENEPQARPQPKLFLLSDLRSSIRNLQELPWTDPFLPISSSCAEMPIVQNAPWS